MEEAPQVPVQQIFFNQARDRAKSLYGDKKTQFILPFIVLLAVVIGIGSILSSFSGSKPPSKEVGVVKSENNFPEKKIVYGFWSQGKSNIALFYTKSLTSKIVTTLPNNVKNVKIVSSNEISYINNTDDRDYGTEIVLRDTQNNSEKVIIIADTGFGIDDYVISPNHQYLAVWEVAPISGSKALLGGKSRIYSKEILSNTKNLIADEISNVGVPVKYPLAVTSDGTIFMDRFLPNSGAGWGYGVSKSDIGGKKIEDIAELVGGTFSSQPALSPDGKKLLFSGYDGSKGPGTQQIAGFRRALSTPNTVEIYNIANGKRSKLANLKQNVLYPHVSWDAGSNQIFINILSQNKSENGTYAYNTVSQNLSKIDSSATNILSGLDAITSIGGNNVVMVHAISDNSIIGNLGSQYSPVEDTMYLYNAGSQTQQLKNILSQYLQYIAVVDSNYFSYSANDGSNIDNNSGSGKNDQLQLQTFSFKPDLSKKRDKQQSEVPPTTISPTPSTPTGPRCSVYNPVACHQSCSDLSVSQCDSLLGKNYYTYEQYQSTNVADTQFEQCVADQTARNGRANISPCNGSPLYLYGTSGESVKVVVGTPIFSPNANYNPEKGFDVILGEEGEMFAGGKTLKSLDFDYYSGLPLVPPPINGFVISKNNFSPVVLAYTKQLGLNDKESHDVLTYVTNHFYGNYAFFSNYDDNISKQILPIFFTPSPKTYRNIVFYMKNLENKPEKNPHPPIANAFERSGFTAVEVSFIIK